MSDIKILERKLIAAIETSARKSLPIIGNEMRKEIGDRTQKGLGVDKNKQDTKKLKPLKTFTIGRRQDLRRAGKLSSKTTPSKSNFTATGHTIDNLQVNVSNAKLTSTVEVVNTKDRKKVRDNAKAGRKWLKASKDEISKARQIVETQFDKVKTKLGL